MEEAAKYLNIRNIAPVLHANTQSLESYTDAVKLPTTELETENSLTDFSNIHINNFTD